MTPAPIALRLEALLKRELTTINLASQRDFLHSLRTLQAQMHTMGAFEYVFTFDRTCSDLYGELAAAYLEHSVQRVNNIGVPWTPGLRDMVAGVVTMQLGRDWNWIVGVRDEHLPRELQAHAIGQLNEAQHIASRQIEEELEAWVLREDTERLPLLDLLAARRYAAARNHLVAARAAAASVPRRDRDVAREALLAVEALARLTVGEPTSTLGRCLDILRRRTDDAGRSLLSSVEKIYAFGNAADSVRHGGGIGGAVMPEQSQFVLEVAEASLRLLLSYDHPSEA